MKNIFNLTKSQDTQPNTKENINYDKINDLSKLNDFYKNLLTINQIPSYTQLNKKDKKLAHFFEHIIKLDDKIEESKTQIIYRQDFIIDNLYYNIFDINNRKAITKYDFICALKKLTKIDLNFDTITLIFNRYCNSINNDIMKLDDFRNMLIPYNNEVLRNIVYNRKQVEENKNFEISKLTIQLLTNLFQEIANTEIKIKEYYKSEISTFGVLSYCLEKLYPKYAGSCGNNLSVEKFYMMLKDLDIIMTEEEFNLLCNRIDKEHKMYFTIRDFYQLLS